MMIIVVVKHHRSRFCITGIEWSFSTKGYFRHLDTLLDTSRVHPDLSNAVHHSGCKDNFYQIWILEIMIMLVKFVTVDPKSFCFVFLGDENLDLRLSTMIMPIQSNVIMVMMALLMMVMMLVMIISLAISAMHPQPSPSSQTPSGVRRDSGLG